MKTLEEIETLLEKHKKDLKEQYDVREIGIFGSYVSGEQSESSDVDILVELGSPMGFVRFIQLERKISELLGVKVDLVTKKALKPYIGQRILQEVRYV
jgi:predicted nucleotidyltransferase